MKVLITGANGYIGKQLLPILLQKGHKVVCLVRNKQQFTEANNLSDKVSIITGNLLKEPSIEAFPTDIDAAYYLLSASLYTNEFLQMALLSAHNFVQALDKTNCKHIIFLTKGANYGMRYGHAQFRHGVEHILLDAKAKLTICKAIPNWHLIWPFYGWLFKKTLNKITHFESNPSL